MDKPALHADSSELAFAESLTVDGWKASLWSRYRVRLRGLAVAACCGGAIMLAWWLTPQARGVGTHEQLGWPACSFLERTGYPCPTCGLTTSVSAMAHGQFALALRSHAFGVLLFAALAGLLAAAMVEAAAGKGVLNRLGRWYWWAWALVLGIPAGWVIGLVRGIVAGTLPIR